jgi:site-specific recombinase XerD
MTRNVHIRKARRDWLSTKSDQKASTIRAYESISRDFVEWLEQQGIEQTQDIDGYLVQQYKIKRREEDNVAPSTLHNNLKHLRVFVKYLQNSELVDYGLYDKIEVPNVTSDQARSDDIVSEDRMEQLLDYLETYEYATRQHAFVQLLWHTGCRISGLVSLDVKDFKPQAEKMTFRNRREGGTPLKNGIDGQRDVTLNQKTIDVLNDYINGRRHNVTDEYGRRPLFTTKNKRMQRQLAYKDFIGLSRPCVYDNSCPHDRAFDNCSAYKMKRKAFECPSTDSLHPIRRGSITYHLKQGWPAEKLSERVDVSVRVLYEHYDARSYEEKRQGRKKFVETL